MKSCKLFDCDFWGAKVCCATCPKKDLVGRARCSTPCQNEPTKCGSYIAYEADTSVREDFLKKKREYYHQNAERCKAASRERYWKNKEKMNEYCKVYYSEHKAHCQELHDKWVAKKKAENPNYNKEYRARLKLKKAGEVHNVES